MSLRRREFFSSAIAAAAWAAIAGCRSSKPPAAAAAVQGKILGFGKGLVEEGAKTLYVAAIADLDKRSLGAIELAFFGHGFSRHPKERNRALIFEKKGPGCCEIDLRQGRVTRTIAVPKERHFYGHGVFSSGGDRLFVAQSHLKTHEGSIAVLDGKSLEETGTFPTYGANPHDCLLIDGGKTLVITNGGSESEKSPGNVAFVDAGTRKLLKKLPIPDPKLNAGHVAVSSRGYVVAVSAPRDGLPSTARGGVSIQGKGGSLATMDAPEAVIERMVGESLSVAINEERHLAAVTNPDGNLVTIWDVPTGKLVQTLDVPAARGVTETLDRKNLVVSHDNGKLSLLSWETMELGAPLPLGGTPFSGSHLYTLAD